MQCQSYLRKEWKCCQLIHPFLGGEDLFLFRSHLLFAVSLLIGASNKLFQKFGINCVDNIEKKLSVRFCLLVVAEWKIRFDIRVILHHTKNLRHG